MAESYSLAIPGESVARRTLEFYRQAFGGLEPLLAQFNLLSTPVQQVLDLPLPDLAALSARAIAELAAQDRLTAGKQPLRPSDWRVVRYSLGSARTLREAIAHCADCFEAIDGRCGRMTLRTWGDMAEVQLDSGRPSRSVVGCLIDLHGVAQIHSLFAWLIAQALPLRAVSLDHDPAAVAQLELPPLPFPLRADAPRTAFAFNVAYLDYPVVRTAEELDHRPAVSFLFGEMPDSRPVRSVAEDVRRLTVRALRNRGRLPPFDEVVASVGGSEATLRRRLAREGTTYREIKDSCRRELGLELLRRPELSVEEIATRLDFCDSDAFRRAFHAWTGMAPSHYRRLAV